MPRPVRVHVEGALAYVTTRAAEGLTLFRDQKDYEAYRGIVLEYKAQYGFKLFAAVLLPGELHLALEPSPAASVSAIMHAITSRYTKYYGKRYGHSGHLFQSRFKLTLLEKAPSLLRLTGYLHTLPQRCGASDDVEQYRWSSLASHLVADTSRPGWCSRGEVAEVFGQLQAVRPGWTYALYLGSVAGEEWEQYEQELRRPVVGSEVFQAAVEEKRKTVKTTEFRQEAAEDVASVAASHSVAHRLPSFVLTAGIAVGIAVVITMVLSLRTIGSLKATMSVLAEENQQTFTLFLDQLEKRTGIRLASYARPQMLNGTSWDIQLKPAFGSAGSVMMTDTLAFDRDGKRVSSSQLGQAGFPAAPFAAKREDGAVLWETFQIGPDGETVSWRGQWKGTTMHGVMARQRPGQADETFRFIGIPQTAGRQI